MAKKARPGAEGKGSDLSRSTDVERLRQEANRYHPPLSLSRMLQNACIRPFIRELKARDTLAAKVR